MHILIYTGIYCDIQCYTFCLDSILSYTIAWKQILLIQELSILWYTSSEEIWTYCLVAITINSVYLHVYHYAQVPS